MGKYKFQVGGETDFFNMLADNFSSQIETPQDFEDVTGQQLDTQDNTDYSGVDQDAFDELSSKYDMLQQQFEDLSNKVGAGAIGQTFDDGFLGFLFSDNQNLPIDPEDLMNYTPSRPTSQNLPTNTQGVNPYVLQTDKDIRNKYGLTNMGIWGDKSHQQRKSDHNTGDAEDFGVTDPQQAQSAVQQLQKEAQQRGIKYIIYDKKIWNPSVSNEWRPYSGTSPHTDHIHVSYNRNYQVGGQVNRLNAQEMTEWNQFQDFVAQQKMAGSKDLDSRDKNLGSDLFNKFKTANPNVSITYDIVPRAQYEFALLQQQNKNFSERRGEQIPTNWSDISKNDGWYGSLTSQQRFVPMKIKDPVSGQMTNLGLINGSGVPTSQMSNGTAASTQKRKYQIGDAGVLETTDGRYIAPDGTELRQMGGIASTPQDQYTGLNNPMYNMMHFPMQGTNTFRGLDNGSPVLLKNKGKYTILQGPNQTAKMTGPVTEYRL